MRATRQVFASAIPTMRSLLLAASISLLGSTFSAASPQIATLKALSVNQPSETIISPGRIEISAIGSANAQGATTYVEVVEFSSLVEILPSLTITVFSAPTAFTETFVEDASGLSGTAMLFGANAGSGAQSVVEECRFGTNSQGTCQLQLAGMTGSSAVLTESGPVVPFTTLTAPSPGSTGESQSGGGGSASAGMPSPSSNGAEFQANIRHASVVLAFAMLVGGLAV
ncbi:hypothetical protein R3P38DRAFT_3257659 [Favolaschia claudopus]|uniref:Uncharacterized protein n=1 Tax=Favolaschia claudopus TaxID=2862362 RepID=A0AAW0D181_9AGAR